MSKLQEKLAELDAKRADQAKVWEEAGDELDFDQVTTIKGTTAEKVDWVRKSTEEIEDLFKEVEDLRAIEHAKAQNEKAAELSERLSAPANSIPQGKGEKPATHKSIGELFVESDAYATKGKEADLDVDLKTLFQTSAGWASETMRTGRLVDYASTTPPDFLDYIPTVPTNQSAVVYMEETTYTNAAAETSEAGTYAESAFALTERTSTVRKIAHFIPVTDEQLEDVGQVASYLNNRMTRGLRERLNTQVLTGDGNAPNLTGILNTGSIQTQAKAADTTPDAFFKALVKVRTTGASNPNLTVWNPADWQDVRLLRTADGIYIWGSPSQAGPESIWGLPVIQSQALTANTGLVLDTFYLQLALKRGVTVKTTDSHDDYFIKGKQAIRADMRAAFTVFRPVSVCTVTGI